MRTLCGLANEPVVRRGCKTQPIHPSGFFFYSSFAQVCPSGRSHVGMEEAISILFRGPLQRMVDRLAKVAGTGTLCPERNPGAFGESAFGFDEVDAFDALKERIAVAAGTARPAFERLELRIDIERGRMIFVERAEAFEF